jgi:hypothetical protein
MSRPDPIEYAERLYAAIRDANFSTISFLAFGNAVKDGVELRRMPRIAAEPFMRVVGEMLDLEGEAALANEIHEASILGEPAPASTIGPVSVSDVESRTGNQSIATDGPRDTHQGQGDTKGATS